MEENLRGRRLEKNNTSLLTAEASKGQFPPLLCHRKIEKTVLGKWKMQTTTGQGRIFF